MTRFTHLVIVSAFGALAGACALPGSPVAVGRLAPEGMTSVSDKDLCYAYDHGQSDKPAVVSEVNHRRLNCGRVLLAAGLEPTGAAMSQVQSLAPSGDCGGVEFMGMYVSDAVYGLRWQFAKVRNKAPFTKIVAVGYFQDGKPMTARGEVGAGEIGTIKLALDDHPVTNLRLNSCT
jgi:hypothetical protein